MSAVKQVTITYEPTRLEVPAPRDGRPSYKWVDGLYVVVNGNRLYPPLRAGEAKDLGQQILERGTL